MKKEVTVLRKIAILIVLVCNCTIVFSQDDINLSEDSLRNKFLREGMSHELKVEALMFIHYKATVDDYRNKCALFYFNEVGDYQVNSSQLWQLENAPSIVLKAMPRFSSCELESEQEFSELNLNWLKTQILNYKEKNQANFIFYDSENKLGYLKTYKLGMEEE